jgi:hypothetical protein
MLTIMHGLPEFGITERLAVESFGGGWATTNEYDNLADCRNIMTLAAAERDDKQTLIVCELGLHALLGIKERHAKTGKFGTTGDELAALRLLVNTSESFWLRQSGSVFARHYNALRRAKIKDPASLLEVVV